VTEFDEQLDCEEEEEEGQLVKRLELCESSKKEEFNGDFPNSLSTKKESKFNGAEEV
jgi:hypothetical protein